MAEIQKFKATVPEMLFGDTAYAVETGVESAQQYAFPASSHSNAVSQFQINVPNTSAVMDRRVLLEMPVQLTFACADVSPDTCLIDGRDAWRAYPLDAIMDNVKVTINGLGISTQPRWNRIPLSMYAGDDARRLLSSISPSQVDSYADYEDAVGATNSPFGNIQGQEYSSAVGRAGYDWTIVSNTGTGAVVTAVLRTWIKLAPFLFGNNDEAKGLVNVNDMLLTCSYVNLARMWSRDNEGRPLTSLTVTLEKPTLYTTFYNAGLNTMIPSSVDYAYANIVINDTAIGSVGPYAQSTRTTTAFRFDIVPSYIYLWVGRAFSDIDADVNKSVGTTDSVFSIQKVSILFDNRSSLLGEATPAQLYQFSVQEGLNQGFVSFVGRSQIIGSSRIGLGGSVLKISFGKMLGLKSGVLPGQSGVYNFSSTLTFTNESKRAVDAASIYVLNVQEGLLRIGSGAASSYLGVMTAADYGSLEELPDVPQMPVHIYGGSFSSKAMQMLSSAVRNPKLCKAATSKVCDMIASTASGSAKGGRTLKNR
jgi:hypothetical protein